MTKHIEETDTHYSPATREAILNRLLTSLRSDKRLAGLLVVGSGSVGIFHLESVEFPRVFRQDFACQRLR